MPSLPVGRQVELVLARLVRPEGDLLPHALGALAHRPGDLVTILLDRMEIDPHGPSGRVCVEVEVAPAIDDQHRGAAFGGTRFADRCCRARHVPIAQRFVELLKQRLAGTVWQSGGCRSWYQDQKTGENPTIWPGSVVEYIRRTRKISVADYALSGPIYPARAVNETPDAVPAAPVGK